MTRSIRQAKRADARNNRGRPFAWPASIAAAALCFFAGSDEVRSQVDAPNYEECVLEYIYPAGGQRGQTISVEFGGRTRNFGGKPIAGLQGARDIVVDGPPGITVSDVRNVSDTVVRAQVHIAADAVFGRRYLRVLSDRSGITNSCFFTVGALPECREHVPNSSLETAERIKIPTIVNGQLDPELDADCFRFEARAGQHLVLAVLAHHLDSRGNWRKNRGFVDTEVELFDAAGTPIAEASDTLGLDPLIEFDVPADGQYTTRLRLVGHQGFPQAVYRLIVGEVPVVTSVFPSGGRRGTTVEVQFFGHNVPADARQLVSLPQDGTPLPYLVWDNLLGTARDVPFVCGDWHETIEEEPNDDGSQATPLNVSQTINARFLSQDDEDWYVLSLQQGQKVELETLAQGHLRSPADTVIEVFDAKRALVAQNDDASKFEGESPYDFTAFDSRIVFAAAREGDYFVRVSNQSGAFGNEVVYRLTAREVQPDFRLYVWPDAVPIWGPGSSAACVVKIERLSFLKSDVELRVDGLPPGWTGSINYSMGASAQQGRDRRAFLTITAPPEAPVGSQATFRVVGRATIDGRIVERFALPLTLYHGGDRQQFRMSPTARAVVAASRGPYLETDVRELTVVQGGAVEIPIRVSGETDLSSVPVVVNLAGKDVRCSLCAPLNLKPVEGRMLVPLDVTELPPGAYGIVVSRTWSSDIRSGMPGPCTPVILLRIQPKAKATVSSAN